MARAVPEVAMRRFDDAQKVKDLWRSQHSDAYALALPGRNLYNQDSPGAFKNDNVFDSTLMISTFRFANRLQSEITPAFQKWLNFIPGVLIPDEDRVSFRVELDKLRDVFFAALHISNFDTAINEYFLELAIGTAAMLVLPGDDDNPILFHTVPQAQLAFEEGPRGIITGVFRTHLVKGRNIERTWPNMIKPSNWEDWLKDNDNEDITIFESTYNDVNGGTWYYDIFVKDNFDNVNSTSETYTRIVEQDFNENPWIVTRWMKVPGEVQGRGPVLFALPDAKVLNKVKEMILKNGALAVAGIWTVRNDGVINSDTVKIVPGAIIPVGATAGTMGPSIQSIAPAGDFNVAQIIVEDLVSSIKTIMLDNQLPPDTGAVRSPTEIIARLKELQQDIGSPFGRMMIELIRPLASRVLNILAAKRLIPNATKVVVDGRFVDVQVTSPLAQADSLSEIEQVTRLLELSSLLGEDILRLGIKVEEIPEHLGLLLGVDTKILRSPDERKELMEEAKQRADEQQRFQQAAQDAQAQRGGIGIRQNPEAVAA